MLTLTLLRELNTEAGRALLARALTLIDDPFAADRLRDGASLELAAAAVDQVRLRRRAAAKFSRASRMWFTGPLLEQASGEVVSRRRARRYAGRGEVLDLCCGLGGDALALAERGPVAAIDRDPLALELARLNTGVYVPGASLRLVQADLPGGAPPCDAAWIDPGRREGGRRTRGLEAISPTLPEVLSLRPRIPNLGVKLSPAAPDAELNALLAGIPHERQFLSVSGECRELVVWLGDLAMGDRTATVLPQGAELAGAPVPLPPPEPLAGFLLEPDPAVIRAGLVGNLAAALDAAPLDERLAYLTTAAPVETPFATGYRIEVAEPFSGKALAKLLRERGASDVVLKTRGFAGDPEALRRQLRPVLKHGEPHRAPVVFLTRLAGRAAMLLGERLGAGREEKRAG